MLTRSCNVPNKENETRKANLNLFPIEILVLQHLLSVKDISRLDIAICNVDSRLFFLNSLQSVKIRDDAILGRGDNFVTWVIKRQIKLINLKVHSGDFTRISADKMAAGEMKLDAIEEFQWNTSLRHGTLYSAITRILSKIVTYCPMIRLLDFDNFFENATIMRVAEYCPMLQNLKLSRCTTLTDIVIMNIAECCSLLQILELKCSSITDTAIIRIAECCQRLKVLRLRCPAITNIAIIRIAECCPRFKGLILQCSTNSDIAIVRIAESCLQCPAITNIAIIRLAECCLRLKNLVLQCPAITDIAIIRIAECCPR
jgi:hypothetical protein